MHLDSIAASCSVCGQQMEFRPPDQHYHTALWQCVECGRFEVGVPDKPQESAVAARANKTTKSERRK